MPQKHSSLMPSLWILGLGFLVCGPLVCGSNRRLLCHHRKTCKGIRYDGREAACCDNSLQPGPGLSCCGEELFDPATAKCCKRRETEGSALEAKVTPGIGEAEADCCGLRAFNPLNQICCEGKVLDKPAPEAKCCGAVVIDEAAQLCCGSLPNRFPVRRNSRSHKCCSDKQFDTLTHCCCDADDRLNIEMKPNHGRCCEKTKTGDTPTGLQLQTPAPRTNCNGPHMSVCGSSCYNTADSVCCQRDQTLRRRHGNSDGCGPNDFNPRTHICCGGCLSPRKSSMDRCCGERVYSAAQPGVLCCDGTLYTNRQDGEECSDMGFPFHPAKGTLCCSQFHGSPGQHCCGTETYSPHTEICCDGHRHPKREHHQCCGIRSYDIIDMRWRCCAGKLHDLTTLMSPVKDVSCCGSVLQIPQNNTVCCSSEEKQVLYGYKPGFKCCGHFHYSTSLWSCCGGKLSPGPERNHMDDKFLWLHNLNDTDLCEEINVGIVESVTLNSIVFHRVLKIHGKRGTVKTQTSPHILHKPGPCHMPKLNPGSYYFFSDDQVFAGFNQDPSQALHHIILKCHRHN